MGTSQLKSFWNLNKDVTPFLLKVASLTFSSFALILYLLVSYILGEWHFDIQFALITFLVSSILFPVFTFTAAYIEWSKNDKARQKAYSKFPFNELHMLGFTSCITGNKWTFFEEIKYSQLAGFNIYADIDYENRKCLQFHFIVEYPNLPKKKFKQLKKELKALNIQEAINSVFVQYETTKPSVNNIDHLEKELLQVTNILAAKGLISSPEPHKAKQTQEK